MVSVCRIGHVSLETPDIASEVAHYTEVVGLVETTRESNRVILSTSLGEEVLILEKGSSAQVVRMAFQVAPGSDFDEIERSLQEAGIRSRRASNPTPAISDTLLFEDPRGTTIELFSEAKQPLPAEAKGIMPLKLGHVAYVVPSPQVMVDFYTNVLGFRVSDWMGDYFAFLRCGPDHHTVNFVTGERSGMHHMAFELKDWSHVQQACEVLGQKNIKIIWGPGRHGIGHNVFVYHRDKDDHIVEFYIEMDQMKDEALGYFEPRPWHKDRPQRPKVWERGPAGLVWGTPPTEDFLRSHFRKPM